MTETKRTDAEWIGDIGHRTLERLEKLAPELALLQQQFRLLARWGRENSMGGSSTDLYINAVALDLSTLTEPVQAMIGATGRVKQEYHHYGE